MTVFFSFRKQKKRPQKAYNLFRMKPAHPHAHKRKAHPPVLPLAQGWCALARRYPWGAKMAGWAFRHYRPHVELRIERSGYSVATAATGEELLESLRLRQEVFGAECGARAAQGMDVDHFDFLCDHLVVRDKKTSSVIGTYRLLSSWATKHYYTETEFHLGPFPRWPGVKLELGRACVKKSSRSGIALALLWQGVITYAEKIGARYLFGASSIWCQDPARIAGLQQYLSRRGYADPSLPVRPKHHHRFPQLARATPEETGAEELIPPLLLGYLKAGAKVAREPALDRSFGTVDFFTLLDFSRMNPAHERKFGSGEHR